jgi:hypothetical protein
MSTDGDQKGPGVGFRPLSFLDRDLPPSFLLRVIVIAPGSERAYEAAEWADSLVIVERGEIEVVCVGGTTYPFRVGHILCPTALPLLALRNRTDLPAVLAAVSRRLERPSFG